MAVSEPDELELTREQARQIAVRAQLLDAHRPTGVHEVVRRLTLLQIDPTNAIARSADLVLWSRLGSAYATGELRDALADHTLVEFGGMVRPAEDMALYGAEMAAWPGPEPLVDWQEYIRDWVRDNDACREGILAALEADGPLRSRDLPDTCVRPWKSTGWTNNQNVTKLLGFMEQRGEVAVAGRQGRERLYDLAERVYPDDPIVPLEQARRRRAERRLAALGIGPARGSRTHVEPDDISGLGIAAVVRGVPGKWRVDPTQAEWIERGEPFAGRAALLSPYDRLVYDRKRLAEIFAYDYQLEMYKPAAQRRWGYFALPILYADRLVGKLDATADRESGALRVTAIHQDERFTRAVSSAVRAEIEDLARWLGLEPVLPRRTG